MRLGRCLGQFRSGIGGGGRKLIGHWNVRIEFGDIKPEARNMGIAPMVPAQKILEILRQSESRKMAH